MIGLKYIRKKYGYTMTELAQKMNVTKQMVSLWESGAKEISDSRKNQLAGIFEVEAKWFGEVSEDEIKNFFEVKKQLADCCMDYHLNLEGNYLLIETNGKKSYSDIELIQRYMTLINDAKKIGNPEEMISLRDKQKEVEKKIHESFLGEIEANLNEQMNNLTKLIDMYSEFVKIINTFNKLDPTEKDGSYRRIMDKLKEIQKY